MPRLLCRVVRASPRHGETVTEYWARAADVASATVIPLSNGELRTDISRGPDVADPRR